MNSAEWLTSADPQAMLDVLGEVASERKLRLFACAYARTGSWLEPVHDTLFETDPSTVGAGSKDFASLQAWALELRRSPPASLQPLRFDGAGPRKPRPSGRPYQEIVAETSEAYADDPVEAYLIPVSSSWERRAANARGGLRYRRLTSWIRYEEMELVSAMCEPRASDAAQRAIDSAVHRFLAVANDDEESEGLNAEFRQPLINQTRLLQAELLREIFGDPFQPPRLDRQRLDAALLDAAESIYERRAYDELPYLSDALADTEIVPYEIVEHLGQARSHVRGCWALDLIIGKT